MDRSEKKELVSSLHSALLNAGLVVVTQQKGMTVAETTNLRRKMRAGQASFKVAKNRLAKLALVGTPYENLSSLLKGPTALAYSTDPVAAAKVIVEFAKTNDKLTVVGGALPGTVLNSDGVKALATLPSLDELRGKLIGVLQAPAQKVAAVIQAPVSQLARVVKAYADKDEAAA